MLACAWVASLIPINPTSVSSSNLVEIADLKASGIVLSFRLVVDPEAEHLPCYGLTNACGGTRCLTRPRTHTRAAYVAPPWSIAAASCAGGDGDPALNPALWLRRCP